MSFFFSANRQYSLVVVEFCSLLNFTVSIFYFLSSATTLLEVILFLAFFYFYLLRSRIFHTTRNVKCFAVFKLFLYTINFITLILAIYPKKNYPTLFAREDLRRGSNSDISIVQMRQSGTTGYLLDWLLYPDDNAFSLS